MPTDAYPTPDLDTVDVLTVLRALSDPVRLQIVRILADGEPHSKGPDVWGLQVEKSTLSHHFKLLRESGLTRTIVNGRSHDIQLRRPELDARFPGLLDAILADPPNP